MTIMESLTFDVNDEMKTNYGFNLKFTYTISVKWFSINCQIKVMTLYQRKTIFEIMVSDEEYKNTIYNIKYMMKSGQFRMDLVKDYGRCIACKSWMDDPSDTWKYERYDIFCSSECKKKPIADKCILCSQDVPRSYTWRFLDYCSKYCAYEKMFCENINIPKEVIRKIIRKV